jgi:hypothetical protein
MGLQDQLKHKDQMDLIQHLLGLLQQWVAVVVVVLVCLEHFQEGLEVLEEEAVEVE